MIRVTQGKVDGTPRGGVIDGLAKKDEDALVAAGVAERVAKGKAGGKAKAAPKAKPKADEPDAPELKAEVAE